MASRLKIQMGGDDDGTFDSTIEYSYADNGLRISTTEDGATTLHHFNTMNPTGHAQVLEEGVDADADGRLDASEVEKTFTLGHDVLAQHAPSIAAGELLTFLYDAHGSTRALVDTTGVIHNDTSGGNGIQAFTYDAYGNLIATSFGAATQADALTSLLYSGEFTNATTGLQYLRARFYNPMSGRFNRLDPITINNLRNAQSLHKYGYAHANPISHIDPSGQRITTAARITVQSITRVIIRTASTAIRGARAGVNFARPLPTIVRNMTGRVVGRYLARLTPSRYHHILKRHYSGVFNLGNASKFNNPNQIRRLINVTVRSSRSTIQRNIAPSARGINRLGWTFQRRFSFQTGVSPKGKPLYSVRVAVSPTGQILSAFPVP